MRVRGAGAIIFGWPRVRACTHQRITAGLLPILLHVLEASNRETERWCVQARTLRFVTPSKAGVQLGVPACLDSRVRGNDDGSVVAAEHAAGAAAPHLCPSNPSCNPSCYPYPAYATGEAGRR